MITDKLKVVLDVTKYKTVRWGQITVEFSFKVSINNYLVREWHTRKDGNINQTAQQFALELAEALNCPLETNTVDNS